MTAGRQQLRVCTYNIHKGFCAVNARPILPELRHAIRSVDTDLVFLQEVVGERLDAVPTSLKSTAKPRGQLSSLEYPQFEFLADDVWPHHAYGCNAIYQQGHHGNAILSKNPFQSWENHDVSQWWFSRRGILLGKLQIGVYVACIHFGLFSRERRKQLAMLLELLSQQLGDDQPLIVAGDFNDWTGSLHRIITDKLHCREAYSEINGSLAKTFPARFPLFAMDRIYYRNLHLIDADILSGSPWERLSDHRALYASFLL